MAAGTFSDAEVAARLAAELPSWRIEDGRIGRTYRTHGWKGTLMVVNAIGHLAEAAFHHPDLGVSYASVEVRLMNHAAGGITESDFALAKMIEQVVMWQPGREEGPLSGTPADPRFAYIRYEES
ncbi:4a-hydroxytetrahydrobiopterin dehydratase [Jiella sp. M17.18]|uniref:4a-hydroxytetrahydrobiopterin dehydratase n=1 Tax=Jiella sp. M17.18 TaxID=3234247 RepID=UPI0034DF958E